MKKRFYRTLCVIIVFLAMAFNLLCVSAAPSRCNLCNSTDISYGMTSTDKNIDIISSEYVGTMNDYCPIHNAPKLYYKDTWKVLVINTYSVNCHNRMCGHTYGYTDTYYSTAVKDNYHYACGCS